MIADSIMPLVLRRSYRHNRLRVFDAFATADALERWFSPASDIATKVIEFDFRSRGRYRIKFALPDGAEISVGGEFTRIDRPAQLCFSWCWEEPDPHAGICTFVTIDFIEKAAMTEVVVSHEKMEGSAARDRHAAGWLGALERLQAWLGPMAQEPNRRDP